MELIKQISVFLYAFV